jgi:hypothetical protein
MMQLPGDVDEAVTQRVEEVQAPGDGLVERLDPNSPWSAAWMIATFKVWVCRFGVSLYNSMASMPLSRFIFAPCASSQDLCNHSAHQDRGFPGVRLCVR